MNKKGMTLLELLVYMVLAAFLLAPVIMLMRNSSVTMARDAANVDLRITGRDLLNIIYDDLKNTGFKLNNFKSEWRATFISAADSAAAYADTIPFYCHDSYDWSSIRSGNSAGFYDSLTIRKGKLNPGGGWAGIDTIFYWVEGSDSTLKRGYPNRSNFKTIARNVVALKFRYSEDLADWEDEIESSSSSISKKDIKYIKAIIVLKDNKKLAPVSKQKIVHFDDSPGGILEVNDQALYERHEVVVPVPNNGLFIEEELAIYNSPSDDPCSNP
jgi:type II secretory pathway pseudopilin PulG